MGKYLSNQKLQQQVTACNLNRGVFGKMKLHFHEEILS